MKTKKSCHHNGPHVGHLIIGLMLIFTGACSGSDEDSVEEFLADSDTFSAAMVEEVLREQVEESGADRDEQLQLIESISQSRQNAITRAVENASRAVVSVTVTERFDQSEAGPDDFFRYFFGQGIPREFTNMGSGFLISEDGLIITNQHVLGQQAEEAKIATLDGRTYNARVIGSDELTDLALLKIDAEDPLPYVEFSDSEDVIVGEWAIAIGNPFGLFEDGYPGVTVGVVSAINRDFRPDPNNPRVYIDMIQTDAAINRGNSGGPLLNSEGEVIGVNTFIYTGGTSAGFVGLGFAIPSNRVERIINQLLTTGEVALDYDPGMSFTSMTEQLVYRYRLPAIQGLLITSVNKDGPAFEAGVMPGDIILQIGEERVLSEMHARAILREYYEGDRMSLKLLRDGMQYETSLLLRKRAMAGEVE